MEFITKYVFGTPETYVKFSNGDECLHYENGDTLTRFGIIKLNSDDDYLNLIKNNHQKEIDELKKFVSSLNYNNHGVYLYDSNDYWMGRRTAPFVSELCSLEDAYEVPCSRSIYVIINPSYFDGIINLPKKYITRFIKRNLTNIIKRYHIRIKVLSDD